MAGMVGVLSRLLALGFFLFVAGASAVRLRQRRHPRAGLLALATSRQANGAVQAQTNEYFGKVEVGDPPQVFEVLFDTGSGNLILPATGCRSMACNFHRKYDASHSRKSMSHSAGEDPHANDEILPGVTVRDMMGGDDGQTHVTLTFGQGAVKGHLVTDKVCLGGMSEDLRGSTLLQEKKDDPEDSAPPCAGTVNFVGAEEESGNFLEISADGILGLGGKELSIAGGYNLLGALKDSNALGKPMFAVFLNGQGGGEITFGGYKEEHLGGGEGQGLVWTDVVGTEGYWQVKVDDVSVNGNPLNLGQVCGNGGCSGVLDTGSSMFALPTPVLEKFKTALLGNELAKQQEFPCEKVSSLPELSFGIAGQDFGVKPADYTAPTKTGGCALAMLPSDGGAGNVGGGDDSNIDQSTLILGTPFLRGVLSVYDMSDDGMRVGLAKAAGSGSGSGSSGSSSGSSGSSDSSSGGAPPAEKDFASNYDAAVDHRGSDLMAAMEHDRSGGSGSASEEPRPNLRARWSAKDDEAAAEVARALGLASTRKRLGKTQIGTDGVAKTKIFSVPLQRRPKGGKQE